MERENYSVLSAGWGDDLPSDDDSGSFFNKLGKKWVKSCNVIGNQQCIKVVNRTPFELVARLEMLGVVYREGNVPAFEGEDGAASFATTKLQCGLAWYTVAVQACSESAISESMIMGPKFTLHGVYAGSDIEVCGSDPRYLEVRLIGNKANDLKKEESSQEISNSANESQTFAQKENSKFGNIMRPVTDSITRAIDALMAEPEWSKAEIQTSASLDEDEDLVGYRPGVRIQHPIQDQNENLNIPSRGRFAKRNNSTSFKQPEAEDVFLKSLAP